MTRPGKGVYIGCVGLFLLIYAILFVRHEAMTTARLASNSSTLADIRVKLAEYHSAHNSCPATLADLGMTDGAVRDSFSMQPFLYFPHGQSGVLIAQPQPFRTKLWPLGGMKQVGILTNNELADVYPLLSGN